MNNVMRNLRDILDLGLWERRAVCYYNNRTSFSRTVCAGRSDSRLFVFVCVCLLDDRAPPSEVVNAVARIMTGYGFNQNPLELLGTGDIDRYTHTLMFFCYIHRCNGFLSLVSSFSLWPFLLLVQTFALDCCRISRLYYLDRNTWLNIPTAVCVILCLFVSIIVKLKEHEEFFPAFNSLVLELLNTLGTYTPGPYSNYFF